METAPMAKYKSTAGWYVGCWRRARAIVEAGGRVRMGWAGMGLDARAFRREMQAALDRRINHKAGLEGRGRKWDPAWQVNMSRDARQINEHYTRRVSLRLCNLSTLEMRRRYAGRISANYSEDW